MGSGRSARVRAWVWGVEGGVVSEEQNPGCEREERVAEYLSFGASVHCGYGDFLNRGLVCFVFLREGI